MNTAWIAGFFDGEGCVHFQKKGVRITIGQKERISLDMIKRFYGFGIVSVHDRREYGTFYDYRITKRDDILHFLRSIRQYSICKRKDIEIGILYLNTIDKSHVGYKLSDSIKKTREKLRLALPRGDRYKRRGIHNKTIIKGAN